MLQNLSFCQSLKLIMKLKMMIILIEKSILFKKLYLLFVQSVKPVFDIYNKLLQSEEFLVHLLQENTLNLYKTLLTRFLKSHVTAQSHDILSLIQKILLIIKKAHLSILNIPPSNTHYLKILLKHQSIQNFSRKFTSFALKPAVTC